MVPCCVGEGWKFFSRWWIEEANAAFGCIDAEFSDNGHGAREVEDVGYVCDKGRYVKGCNVPAGVVAVGVFDEGCDDVLID